MKTRSTIENIKFGNLKLGKAKDYSANRQANIDHGIISPAFVPYNPDNQYAVCRGQELEIKLKGCKNKSKVRDYLIGGLSKTLKFDLVECREKTIKGSKSIVGNHTHVIIKKCFITELSENHDYGAKTSNLDITFRTVT